ncbi:hypothetical protein GCM10027091_63870 [Streptomyces daliensis]
MQFGGGQSHADHLASAWRGQGTDYPAPGPGPVRTVRAAPAHRFSGCRMRVPRDSPADGCQEPWALVGIDRPK